MEEKTKRPMWIILWLRQFRLLMWKNWILAKRSKRALLVQILAPILFVLLLLVIDAVVRANRDSRSDDNIVVDYSKRHSVGKIPRCTVGFDEDYCYTFVYAPNNSSIIDTIIQGIMSESNIPAKEVRGFTNSSVMDAWIYSNQNVTAGGYQFELSDVNGTTLISYAVISNETNSRRFGKIVEYPYYVQMPMYVALERQLLRYVAKNSSLELDVTVLDFPHPELEPIDVISAAAPIFFFGAIMFNFVIAVSQIVTEKELLLRNSLNMIGLMDSVFWCSWFCLHIIFSTGTVFLIIIFSAICQFDFILKNNFLTYFLALWTFALAMVSFAFLISTLFKRAKNATAVGFAVFVSGFLLQLTVGFIYADGLSVLYKVLQYVFAFYAPILLAKALGDIAGATSRDADSGLSASDIIDYTSTFPLIEVYIFLVFDFFVYLIIALYLDNVLPDAKGARKPFYYFVLPSYWSGNIRHKSSEPDTDPPAEDSMDADVYKEEMAVRNDEMSEDVVVKVCGLNKTYKGSRKGGWLGWFNKCSCRCCPTRLCGKKIPPYKAVNDVWFSINANTLFCLLGPNGAGKTTTISMLTGQLPPTKGDASLHGYSILNQVPQIQRFMGVCPQFDVLWDDLTGKEHLELFAGMKGLKFKQAKKEAKEKLQEVALTSARNKPARTYSGGMKRRLSVAIALIGDPKIVFLDEPTTGMDPVSRRQVWNIIEKAKKDRVVVLTTHSMEEADILGDRIAIMAFGQLRCIGSSLRLKSKYGTGYRITIGADPNNVQKIIDFVESRLEGAELESEPVAGYMTFDVPAELTQELPNFLESLDENKEELGIIDTQLSLTTLEEVFLKIVNDAEEEQKASGGIQESKNLSDTFGINIGSVIGVKRPTKSNDL